MLEKGRCAPATYLEHKAGTTLDRHSDLLSICKHMGERAFSKAYPKANELAKQNKIKNKHIDTDRRMVVTRRERELGEGEVSKGCHETSGGKYELEYTYVIL